MRFRLSTRQRKIVASFGLVFVIAAAWCLLAAPAVRAQVTTSAANYTGLTPVGQSIGLPATDIRVIAAKVIRAVLGLLGIVVLILVIYAGFLWMTAGGNEEKIAESKSILKNSVIGLLIILSAYGIVSFVIHSLETATGFDSGNPSFYNTNPNPPDNVFYVASLPSNGPVCIRNVHPVVTFSKPVSTDSLTGSLVLLDSSGNIVSGSWGWGQTKNVAIFTPVGDCTVTSTDANGNVISTEEGPPYDCLAPGANYTLHFASSTNIQTVDGSQKLDCTYRAGCHDVQFITGTGVDRLPPTIWITQPTEGEKFQVGSRPQVTVNYTDDNGVQNITLNSKVQGSIFDPTYQDSVSIAGCSKSGSVNMTWQASGLSPNTYTLEADGMDWAAHIGSGTVDAGILPAHCSNRQSSSYIDGDDCIPGGPSSQCPLNEVCNSTNVNGTIYNKCSDEYDVEPGTSSDIPAVDCGINSECGKCSGDPCNSDTQCKSNSCVNNLCVDTMKITGFSPTSGAATSTFVSIYGQFFGNQAGKVFFSTNGPNETDTSTDVYGNLKTPKWIQANPAPCPSDPNFNWWNDNQIIVQVPGLISSTAEIAVEAYYNPFVNPVVPGLIDTTKEEGLAPFSVNNKLHPELCSITGAALTSLFPPSAADGAQVDLNGVNLNPANSVTSNDLISFGNYQINADKDSNGNPIWSNNQIAASVPGIAPGSMVVSVTKNYTQNGQTYQSQSNGLQFNLTPGAAGTGTPLITHITPSNGPNGQTLTITGSNFGTNGTVSFKRYSGDPDVIQGVANFPAACQGKTWSNNQIIIQFPTGQGTSNPDTKYFVQVNNADSSQTSPFDQNQFYILQPGEAGPSLCYLDPSNAPMPFAPTNPSSTVNLYGTYFFSTDSYGNNTPDLTNVYFYNGTGDPNGDGVTLSNRTEYATHTAPFALTDTTINVRPPTDTQSGSVFVYRASDGKVSNPLAFSTKDCRSTTGFSCSANDPSTPYCCPGNGQCLANASECSDTTRFTGYTWRFSTQDIPPRPHVVQRCGVTTDPVPPALPSPSPSIQWDSNTQDVNHQVCQTALVTVEFTTLINSSTLANNIEINHCNDISGSNNCVVPTRLNDVEHTLDFEPASNAGESNGHDYISFKNPEKWANESWYQVVLSNGILSEVSNPSSTPQQLAEDFPCYDANGKVITLPNGSKAAYCFMFKGGPGACVLGSVIVTPYKWWTNQLEAPMLNHAGATAYSLFWHGNGLSTQRCIMMDVSGYNWSWAATNPAYANIFGTPTGTKAQGSSIVNTVGILPGDATDFTATASTTTIPIQPPKTGTSTVTVDLSNPQVVDYWPNCQAACTNAEVGVQFNIPMSTRNVTASNPLTAANGSIQLLKCNDENCFSTTSVWISGPQSTSDVTFDPTSHNEIIEIGNSQAGSFALATNTLYEVILSTSNTTDLSNPQLLWSASSAANNYAGYTKPYANQFAWRFRTKGSICQVASAIVTPPIFQAELETDRSVYAVQPYSAPDACNSSGQKINPWSVNWQWSSSSSSVATVTATSTVGSNSYCTANCIRKGSTVPSTAATALALCGNGRIDAGEDCDGPNLINGCGLDCRFTGDPITTSTAMVCSNDPFQTCTVATAATVCGTGSGITCQLTTGYCGDGNSHEAGKACDPNDPATKIGCNPKTCLNTGSAPIANAQNTSASICGNGLRGSGEDCDIGIPGDVSNSSSAFGCSAVCLHLGTPLSSAWCLNSSTASGFAASDIQSACANSISQCGDGVTNPDEDPGCDLGGGKHADWCNDNCLVDTASLLPGGGAVTTLCNSLPNKNASHTQCVECIAGSIGCNEFGENLGSSLLYSDAAGNPAPSVCGDGVTGLGENSFCESSPGLVITAHAGMFNPWALAIGVGQGLATGSPAAQRTTISAATTTTNGKISGSGQFVIPCGYTSDQDCQTHLGRTDVGVGSDSCCYARSILTSTTPPGIPLVGSNNVCLNTAIQANFTGQIDPATVPTNFLVARGVTSTCASSTDDVTNLITPGGLASTVNVPWYKALFSHLVAFVRGLFGLPAAADVTIPRPAAWCTGSDNGAPTVVSFSTSTSQISFQLSAPLAPTSYYTIILTPGIKNTAGVSIGQNAGADINWQFSTSDHLCTVNKVTVTPPTWYFSRPGDTETLRAAAFYDPTIDPLGGGSTVVQQIQPIPGFYTWAYGWAPPANPSVGIASTVASTNTIFARNQNGQADVRATAVVTENNITSATGTAANASSHVIVFLCENPWPPKFASNFIPGQVCQVNGVNTLDDCTHGGDTYCTQKYPQQCTAAPAAHCVAVTTGSCDNTYSSNRGATCSDSSTCTPINAPQCVVPSGKVCNSDSGANAGNTCTTNASCGAIPPNVCFVGGQQTATTCSNGLSCLPLVQNSSFPTTIIIPNGAITFNGSLTATSTCTFSAPNRRSTGQPIYTCTVPGITFYLYVEGCTAGSPNSSCVSTGISNASGMASYVFNVPTSTLGTITNLPSLGCLPNAPVPLCVAQAKTCDSNSANAGAPCGSSTDCAAKSQCVIQTNNICDANSTNHGDGCNGVNDTTTCHTPAPTCTPAATCVVPPGAGTMTQISGLNVFPYSDSATNNDGYNFSSNAFDGSSILPFSPTTSVEGVSLGDGYTNFSSFYCADAGDPNTTTDDLPYLRPTVQTTKSQLQVSSGTCEKTGAVCSTNNDCGVDYVSSTEFVLPQGTNGVCGATTSTPTTQIKFYTDPVTGQAIGCATGSGTCSNNSAVVSWATSTNFVAACIPVAGFKNHSLACYQFPPLKRFILTNNQNSDAIGIQVFSNPSHLTAEQWYNQSKTTGGQGFSGTVQATTVDGYNAVTDGNNVYIDALNYSDSLQSMYSNIYEFSINSNAAPETRQVFGQLLKNLTLNSNLTYNDGYCGASMASPNEVDACSTDLDCPFGQVCAAQTDKLKRDYQRFRDLQQIDASLQNYSLSNGGQYPSLKTGTYLPGQTLSTWPSWSALGNALGTSLPTDPVNQLGISGTCTPPSTTTSTIEDLCSLGQCSHYCTTDADCVGISASSTCTLQDPTTGWSIANRRYNFACATSSYAYRYEISSSTGYELLTNLEDVGVTVTNTLDFITGFGYSSLSRIKGFQGSNGSGICNQGEGAQNPEVTSLISQGSCGDGQVEVNLGEQCDPPSTTVYNYSGCQANSVNGAKKTICDSNCHWEAPVTTTCFNAALCGNGRIDPGESCDDGRLLNGTYNHCNSSCSGKVSAYPAGPGFCGPGGGLNPAYQLCSPTTTPSSTLGQQYVSSTNLLYALNRTNSCNFDCQSYGPYCGDGIVQSQFGEECDGPLACVDANGNPGYKACASDCREALTGLPGEVALWTFDSVKLLQDGSGDSVSPVDVFNTTTLLSSDTGALAAALQATCPGASCPTLSTSGKINNAVNFNGVDQYLNIPHNSALMTPQFSVSMWINPDATQVPNTYPRLLEKGGWLSNGSNDGGYGLEYDTDDGTGPRVHFLIWHAGASFTKIISQPITPGTWTHVVATYDGANMALYINGQLAIPYLSLSGHTNPYAVPVSGQMTVNTDPLSLGRDEGRADDYFKGSIDQLSFYNVALTSSTVAGLYSATDGGWLCKTNVAPPAPTSTAGYCGDGIVQSNEACDNGATINGVPCVPKYGKSCSYCAANCASVITVQPNAYCGDGIINPGSPEQCELAQGSNVTNDVTLTNVYDAVSDTTSTLSSFNSNVGGYQEVDCASEPAAPLTFRKGTKVCLPDCSGISIAETKQTTCEACGLQTGGVSVTGNLLNVLRPTSTDPMFVGDFGSQSSSNGSLALNGPATNCQFTATCAPESVCEEDGVPTTSGKTCTSNGQCGTDICNGQTNASLTCKQQMFCQTEAANTSIDCTANSSICAQTKWCYVNGVNYNETCTTDNSCADNAISFVPSTVTVNQADYINLGCGMSVTGPTTCTSYGGSTGGTLVYNCTTPYTDGHGVNSNFTSQLHYTCSAGSGSTPTVCKPTSVSKSGANDYGNFPLCYFTPDVENGVPTTSHLYNTNNYALSFNSSVLDCRSASVNKCLPGNSYCAAGGSFIGSGSSLISCSADQDCQSANLCHSFSCASISGVCQYQGTPLTPFQTCSGTGACGVLNTCSPNGTTIASAAASTATTTYKLMNGSVVATLDPNPICYNGQGDIANDNYKLFLNNDAATGFMFPVPAVPNPWSYDLLLSPIISSRGLNVPPGVYGGDVTKRPTDVRIVVSWVGQSDFVSGFLNPAGGSTPTLEGSGVSTTYGYAYFTQNDLQHHIWGLWYHGFGETTGQLSEESFTIDTSPSAMAASQYMFYVRSTATGPAGTIPAIKNFAASANLKVSVYLPQDRGTSVRYDIFDLPATTTYFSNADMSTQNPSANYWEVFDVKRLVGSTINSLSDVIQPVTIYPPDLNVSAISVYPSGLIVSGPAEMR